MAQQAAEPAKQGILRRIFGRHNASENPAPQPADNGSKSVSEPQEVPGSEEPAPETPCEAVSPRPGSSRRASYNVVPGLPRAQTFKRQQSEQRTHLEPVQPTPDERRALSMDRRSIGRQHSPISHVLFDNPRTSAPGILGPSSHSPHNPDSMNAYRMDSRPRRADGSEKRPETLAHLDDHTATFHDVEDQNNVPPMTESHSVADSGYEDDDIIARELDTKWILNLSMHFRDRSKREKFFVTYRQEPHTWRRVTISLDYRNAPPDSLESQLDRTRYQRDKNAKIYEAIRESLDDIQFYDTVTNLKLQTSDGRLFVHVMEDGNEIIHYPPVREIRHLNCTQVPESAIVFDSHMSGFVYKVKVGGTTLIKKEIPSPETVDEFLYEINALNALRDSENVIDFYGVVVDDRSQLVKGLLIDYADQGTLIDILYDHRENHVELPWATREKWARQIVQGLADVHESGFVQGDFTLSNIVITKDNDARIIDINRRGCPVGWEPPEAAALIESGHRIGMYIGVKSDLYQLGMVLWAMAVLEDEPEMRGRPLFLEPEDNVPDWYRQVTEICLSPDPRSRSQAVVLLHTFPPLQMRSEPAPRPTIQWSSTLRPSDPARSPSEERRSGLVGQSSSDWSHVSRALVGGGARDYGPSYYPPRGRSPPSRQPSLSRGHVSPHRKSHRTRAWCDEVGSITRSHDSPEGMIFDPDQLSQHGMTVPALSSDNDDRAMDASAQTLKAEEPNATSDPTIQSGEAPPHVESAGPGALADAASPIVQVQAPSPVDQKTEQTASTNTFATRSEEVNGQNPEPVDGINSWLNRLELDQSPSATKGSEDPEGSSGDPTPVAYDNPSGLAEDVFAPEDYNTRPAAESSEVSKSWAECAESGSGGETALLTSHEPATSPSGESRPMQPLNSVVAPKADLPTSQPLTTREKLDSLPSMDAHKHSSDGPVLSNLRDQNMTSTPHDKSNQDDLPSPATQTAPRSCTLQDGNLGTTGDYHTITSCLTGVGGVGDSLPDVNTDNGLLEDDFGLSRPSSFMISTDTNT
ncbi:protein kinase domain-containing protein [Sarocladium implicatum]|nr:protein kinase domain-containing protein [Sarocladium implicatum]